MKVSTHKTFCSLYDTISDGVEMDVQHLRRATSETVFFRYMVKIGKGKKTLDPLPTFLRKYVKLAQV